MERHGLMATPMLVIFRSSMSSDFLSPLQSRIDLHNTPSITWMIN
jgi:hypothetical protein